MEKEALAEALKYLGEAIGDKNNKDYWIGRAIQELSKLIKD